MNSFLGNRHRLANIDEFSGRLKAVRDTTGSDFILARIETLIGGHGLDEALLRADAYREAGADAILIHSRKAVADQILAFAKEWNKKLPVCVVPTKYTTRRSQPTAAPASPRSSGPITPCTQRLPNATSATASGLKKASPDSLSSDMPEILIADEPTTALDVTIRASWKKVTEDSG